MVGSEHLVLSCAKNVLGKVDGLLIEVDDDFPEQADQYNKLRMQIGNSGQLSSFLYLYVTTPVLSKPNLLTTAPASQHRSPRSLS